MHPNLLIVALVLNVAVLLYLKPWALVANWIGARQINAFRVAGLLVILVAVAHGQGLDSLANPANPVNMLMQQTMNQATTSQNVAAWEAHAPLGYVCVKDCTVMEAGLKKPKTPFVVGVIRDQDFETARAIAKANGVNVRGWETPVIESPGYDNAGNDYLLKPIVPKEDKLEQYVFANWYWIVGGVVAIFLFLQFAGGRESNDTDVEDMLDPDYRTGFATDYHGDDAFEVPDGMHSQHQIVPVRSRSASAGR